MRGLYSVHSQEVLPRPRRVLKFRQPAGIRARAVRPWMSRIRKGAPLVATTKWKWPGFSVGQTMVRDCPLLVCWMTALEQPIGL